MRGGNKRVGAGAAGRLSAKVVSSAFQGRFRALGMTHQRLKDADDFLRRFDPALDQQVKQALELGDELDALVARISTSTLVVQAFWSPSTTD